MVLPFVPDMRDISCRAKGIVKMASDISKGIRQGTNVFQDMFCFIEPGRHLFQLFPEAGYFCVFFLQLILENPAVF